MEFNETHSRQVVRASNWASFYFHVHMKKDYELKVYLKVQEVGLDINAMVVSTEDYTKWNGWINKMGAWRADPKLLKGPAPAKPQIYGHFSGRTGFLEKTFQMNASDCALILDNTYSQVNDKTIVLILTERWNTKTPQKDLPSIDEKVLTVPDEIREILQHANDCYVSGHYGQSTVMFRKAVESAIRLKLLQEGSREDELFDSQGNEIRLSKKIALLRSKKLVTQKTAESIEDIKWFGDMGAHSRTRIILEDISDRIEPRVRAFLTGLSLRE